MHYKKLISALICMISLTIISPVPAQESEQENLTLESILTLMGIIDDLQVLVLLIYFR